MNDWGCKSMRRLNSLTDWKSIEMESSLSDPMSWFFASFQSICLAIHQSFPTLGGRERATSHARRLSGNNDNLLTVQFALFSWHPYSNTGHQSGHVDEVSAPSPPTGPDYHRSGVGNGHRGAPLPGRRDASQVCGQRISSAVAGRQRERVSTPDVGTPRNNVVRQVIPQEDKACSART